MQLHQAVELYSCGCSGVVLLACLHNVVPTGAASHYWHCCFYSVFSQTCTQMYTQAQLKWQKAASHQAEKG